MIYRVYSSDPRFKELTFSTGANVLLAEKSRGAKKAQTRNAAGKSSVIEIIHFLLGASVGKGSLFDNSALKDHTFGIEFELLGQRIAVERKTAANGVVTFPGDIPKRLADLIADSNGGDSLKIAQWTRFLGGVFFGLSITDKHAPTFRMLFPYFCRRESEGGMHQPFEFFAKQPPWQKNVAIAYLLGLNANLLSEMEQLRLEESQLKKLKKELKNSELVGDFLGKATNLRGELAIAEKRISSLEAELKDYQVLPEYRHIESEASLIARQLAEIADRNTADKRLIADLSETLEIEQSPTVDNLERLYASAGIQLPEVSLKRLESVKEFHKTVIRNRKAHLQGEIDAAEQRMEKRNSEARVLSERQAQLMGLLQTHGALDQFNRLEEELGRQRVTRDQLKKRLELAHKIERGSAEIKVRKATNHQKLVTDFDEREERLNEAVLLFEELSSALSERSAVLVVAPTEKGLELDIQNAPIRSTGIREQQIFCFDMLLTVMQQQRPTGLDFLVHDSRLFDAMDARQVANAFETAARLTKKHGFQYIVTMNSDDVPQSEFSEDFDFNSYVLPQRLTDKTDDGGLFGFRFL